VRYERDRSTTWTKKEHTIDKVQQLKREPREPRRRTANTGTPSGLAGAVAFIESSSKATYTQIGRTFREEREVKGVIKFGNGRPSYTLRFVGSNSIEAADSLRPGTWIRIVSGEMGQRHGRSESEIHVRKFEVIEPQSWKWCTFGVLDAAQRRSGLGASRVGTKWFWWWN
jgi:hypothetical protein